MNATLVLGVIVLYFMMVFGVSWWTTRRRDRDTETFYRGDRKSPWWVVAIAMIGTSISGVTYVSVPGMVEAKQMSYIQMVIGFVCGYFTVAYILLPLYYRLGLSSIYVYLEQRYGRFAHKTGASFFLLSKYLGCAVRMYLTAVVLQLVLFDQLGVPFGLSVACIMLIVWIYSFRGGVKTLVWTDLLQTLCLLAAMIGFVICISSAMGLDFTGLCTTIADSPMSRVWFFDDANDTRFFWKQFLGGMFTTIAMTGLDQDMMQKNLSCKSLKEAQKNMVSYGFGFLPVNIIFLSLGILLYMYAREMGVDKSGDELFPYLATGINPTTGQPFLPLIVSVLFVLGLVAAAFSSAGSAVTALTTAIMVDFLRKKPSEEEEKGSRSLKSLRGLKSFKDSRCLRGSIEGQRFWVHIINSIMMGFMIYLFHLLASGSVINAVYVVASYTYGPLIGLFFFGMFTKCKVKDGWWIPIICIASPFLCFFLDQHSETWFNGYKIGYEMLLINGALTAFGLFIASNIFRDDN
jgi:Na+/proline symporter